LPEFGQIQAIKERVPRRELKYPAQIEQWLVGWGLKLKAPGKMILIGSGALLWHAAQRGIEEPLSENSMDVDPITHDDEVAELCYEGTSDRFSSARMAGISILCRMRRWRDCRRIGNNALSKKLRFAERDCARTGRPSDAEIEKG
jgi:hypothetical protein